MRWTVGAWIPSVLAMLQVAGLGLPCASLEPGDTESHSRPAHTVDAGHSDAPEHPEASSRHSAPVAEDGALNLVAACSCGCTGGSAVASPIRNLGDALLLDEQGLVAPRLVVPLPLASLPEAAVPPGDIDHVPVRLG